MKKSHLVGTRFGRLLVLEELQERRWGNVRWRCKCDCGNEKIVPGRHLSSGSTQSCGCLRSDLRQDRRFKLPPGCRAIDDVPGYFAWAGARERCRNQKNPCYVNYGGRGIRMDRRWQRFARFYEDMGPCPPGMTLEREDNDGPYSPDNCVWATRAAQRANQRAKKIENFPTRDLLQEIARRYAGSERVEECLRLASLAMDEALKEGAGEAA